MGTDGIDSQKHNGTCTRCKNLQRLLDNEIESIDAWKIKAMQAQNYGDNMSDKYAEARNSLVKTGFIGFGIGVMVTVIICFWIAG